MVVGSIKGEWIDPLFMDGVGMLVVTGLAILLLVVLATRLVLAI